MLKSDYSTLGGNAGASGTVTITGAQSSWTSSGNIVVGDLGDGTLNILSGGTVSNARSIVGNGSSGTVTVSGAQSSWTSSEFLVVGNGSSGTLMISNGGAVSSVQGWVGFSAGSGGNVTVDGAHSSWTSPGNLVVGRGGTGELTISNGGAVSAVGISVAELTGSTGTLNIGGAFGQAAAAPGTLNAPSITFGAGDGLVVFNHTASSYTFAPAITGTGSVTAAAGTTLLTTNNTYSGGTTVTGGTLAGGAENAFSSNSATSLLTTGTLDVGGFNQTIASLAGDSTGVVTNSGATNATLTTGNATSTSFAGVLQDGTAALGLTKVGTGVFTLTGANAYTGGTTISGGTLQLGNGGTSGSITGNVTNNGTLAFNRSDTLTFSGVISGSGAVEQNGAGTTTLTNVNTYTGATTINGGTLAIAAGGSITSDVINHATFNNNGTATGGVTNLGSFTQMAGLVSAVVSNSGVTNANGGIFNGAITNNAGGSFNVGGTVASSGTFSNAANATLAIAGSGDYTLAGLLTNAGTVTVTSGGLLTANAGIANNAGGTLTNNGTVIDDLTNAGLVTNNATYTANVAANTGTIINSTGASWTGNVNTAGVFDNEGTLNGSLTQTAGTLINNGTITNGVTVSGGTFGGTGSVGDTTIQSGGTFTPGSGTPGTSMTINGSLAFQSGALYVISLNPATSSFATVTGTATLAGTVQAVFAPGSYVAKSYDVLHAAGGLGGTTFAGVSGGLPGLTVGLSYTQTDVFLNLTASLGSGTNLNRNQQNVANAINSFFNGGGALPPPFLTLFGLTGSNLANALSQVSGEAATGAQQGAFQLGGQFLNLLLDPFADGRGGAGGGDALGFAPEREALPDDIALAYARAMKAPAYKAPVVSEPKWSVWGSAFGGYNTTKGDAVIGGHDMTARAGGFAAGLDYRVSPDSVIGFGLAGGTASWTLAEGLGGGRSDAFQAGIYGKTHSGPLYLAGAFAFANHWMSTDRTVLGDHLTADFNAQSFGGRIESGYRFATPVVAVTPYAALQAQSFRNPFYSETDLPGGGFGLSYNARGSTDARGELGARFDRTMLASPDTLLTLRSRLAWAHDWVSDPSATAAFQALPGASFVVNGARPASDSALASAGAEIRFANGVTLAAKFDGEFASRAQTYTGTGILRYNW